MPKALICPNCKAPITPDPSKAIMECSYCGFHSKATRIHESPSPQDAETPSAKQDPNSSTAGMVDSASVKRLWKVWLLAFIVIGLLIGLGQVSSQIGIFSGKPDCPTDIYKCRDDSRRNSSMICRGQGVSNPEGKTCYFRCNDFKTIYLECQAGSESRICVGSGLTCKKITDPNDLI